MATVKELREQAKAVGLKGYSRMRKAELEFKLSLMTEPVTMEVSEVRSLRNLSSHEEFQRVQAENAAALMRCETLQQLQEMLKPLDTLSIWASVQAAMLRLCGEAPDWMVGGYKNGASLVMQAKSRVKKFRLGGNE